MHHDHIVELIAGKPVLPHTVLRKATLGKLATSKIEPPAEAGGFDKSN